MTQNNADTLRMRLKQARQEMAVADRQRASLLLRARLFTWLATTHTACQEQGIELPRVVAGFWPLADEPDLRELYRQWHENGVIVGLPVMQGEGQPLVFRPWQPQATLVTGRFGIEEPSDGQPLHPDVIVVPTLGFTRDGDRLGYGKGFYDRTLAHLRTFDKPLTAIGVAWDDANLETLEPSYQPAAHDQRLDAVLTPTDWHPEAPTYGQADR